MQMFLFPELNQAPKGGFRLHRFELLNWGTFNQKIWTIDLEGKTALLTGVNGSGKSTLVDGLLTLLVPNRKRNYNQAGSITGKRERDEKSYILGAFGGERLEVGYGSKTKFLRDKKTISILLAYFHNQVTKKDVCLAQILAFNQDKVQKFFLIAEQQLTIEQDFGASNYGELKQYFKNRGFETFNEFSQYQQSFLKIFGLQSAKALDLFNQTVSLKEIQSFNEFVRHQMLVKVDVQSMIKDLEKVYNDLTIAYGAIKKAKDQLELLNPLEEKANELAKLEPDIQEMQELIKIAPAYFASLKVQLLQQKIETINLQLTESHTILANLGDEIETLEKTKQDLNIALSQNSVTVRLNELKNQIQSGSYSINQQKYKAQRYNQYAQLLEFPEYSNQANFDQTKTVLIPQKEREIEQILDDLKSQRDEQKQLQNKLLSEQKELGDELSSLRQRKNQIPISNLTLRNRIAKALNLAETDLPFVGELLKVLPEEKSWEGAIERLLHNLALSVLVPDPYYPEVSRYVNEHDLKERFVYYHLKNDITVATQRPFISNTVPSKLEIKQDNSLFYSWLMQRFSTQYNYLCCDNLTQFAQADFAITLEGLIKNNQNRYEKDDRTKIGDPKNYVLGWSNAEKIKALETDLREVQGRLGKVNQEIEWLEKEQKQREQQKSYLQNLQNFTNFAEIDWQTSQTKLEQLQQEKAELMASSDQVKQLQKELDEVTVKLNNNKQEEKNIHRKIGDLEGQIRTYQSLQEKAQSLGSQCSESQLKQFEFAQKKRLQKHQLNLDTIDNDQQIIIHQIQDELNSLNRQQISCQNKITAQMSNFKNKFEEDTIEMGTKLENLPEYLKLIKKIKEDDLFPNEARFKNMINDKIVQAIFHFQESLNQQEIKIKEGIDELNQSLKQINYSDFTYIQLQYDKTVDQEIIKFKNEDLRNCLSNSAHWDTKANEQRFLYISELIKRLKEQERWCEKVTDVRNWLNFSVSEYYRENNQEKEHYSESSGKSGGQKAKLAYTVLASAIAHQFGLNQEHSARKSFRFVVIDEAFSKLDDNNARYAMELFKTLNLQLLVVTPKDKIHVIENYIKTIHLVSNTQEENYSSIRSISIQEFREISKQQ